MSRAAQLAPRWVLPFWNITAQIVSPYLTSFHPCPALRLEMLQIEIYFLASLRDVVRGGIVSVPLSLTLR